MVGYPKYKKGDVVSFTIFDQNGIEHCYTGTVAIVDAYGTFEQDEEPSYDILVGEPLLGLFKHIRESGLK